ncbi:DnaA ATPase domain-containing protein [Salibacterium halotolerans]|uniref:DNA replication protein DnaC n=1 Tax=Salibacterium halotolerans TaxID=1884432 RepID=A0A1I5MJJ8_9BACI|nr:DnaA/Hda family protein [Salibacterium halotolerans]SFP09774.1 DNA replication protein DnaC [Salibacterium halotolerans]
MDKRAEEAAVPENFKDAKLNNFKKDVYVLPESQEIINLAFKASKNFVWHFDKFRDEGKGLYFHSNTKGSGKTRLISSITNAINSQHPQLHAIYKKADDLLGEIKSTFIPNVDTEQVIDKFRTSDLLVVDDLGVENIDDKNGWVERTLTDIFDKRLEKNKVTIFSSNYSLSDLDGVYASDRISSRIRKMVVEIPMPEESIRDQESRKEAEEMENILFRG